MSAFLQKAFYNWFEEKLTLYMELFEEPLNELGDYYFEKSGFEKDEFIKKFVEPYQDLSMEQLKEVSLLQTKLSRKYLKNEIFFDAKEWNLYNTFNALMFTLIQVSELNLFLFNESKVLSSSELTLLREYLEQVTPKEQCYFCSRPDEDEYGNKFNKKTKYCYFDNRKIGKQTKSIADSDDCCATRWRIISQYLRNDINRVVTKDLKKYENYTLEDQEKEITRIFIDFCEDSFRRNMRNEYCVQTKNEKAERVSTLYERVSR